VDERKGKRVIPVPPPVLQHFISEYEQKHAPPQDRVVWWRNPYKFLMRQEVATILRVMALLLSITYFTIRLVFMQ
jgi:hypothetical protein